MRLLLLVLLAAAAARADDIRYTSGTVQEDVKVLSHDDKTIVFLGKSLTPTVFPASLVKEVVYKRSTIHEYEDRLAAAKDAAALSRLADWAEARGFTSRVVQGLRERAAGGGGKAPEPEPPPPPAEPERRAPDAEALLAHAREAAGTSLRVHASPRCVVIGDLSQDRLRDLGETMERLFLEWERLFPGTEALPPEGYRLYAFEKPPPYRGLVKRFHEEEARAAQWSPERALLEEERMRLRLSLTSFWDVDPHARSAHVQMPDSFEGLTAHCVHYGANVLATRQGRLAFPSSWLNEGLAYWLEERVTGLILTVSRNVGGVEYGKGKRGGHSKSDPWIDSGKWTELLADLVEQGKDPPLDGIRRKNLHDPSARLSTPELAKAWSVVGFLVREDAETFAAFFADSKRDEAEAVFRHYGGYPALDGAWRAYVRNGFRPVR